MLIILSVIIYEQGIFYRNEWLFVVVVVGMEKIRFGRYRLITYASKTKTSKKRQLIYRPITIVKKFPL